MGDACDNCVFVFNPVQVDNDSDGAGTLCDADDDDERVGRFVLIFRVPLVREGFSNNF